MTTWSQLFAGSLPAPTPPDLGKALMVRTGPAWVPDFIRADDVSGPWHVPQVINQGPTAFPAYDADSLLQLIGNTGHQPRIEMVGFGTAISTSIFGRTANGTAAAPTATKAGDQLTSLIGGGRAATAFTIGRAQIKLQAALDWTDASQATQVVFSTTAQGSAVMGDRWQINHDGPLIPSSGPLDIGALTAPIRDLYAGGRLLNGAGEFWYTALNATAPYKQRWGAYLWPVDTGSGNGGSDLYFTPWADDGSIMSPVLTLIRATGDISVRAGVSVANIKTSSATAINIYRDNIADAALRWQVGHDNTAQGGSNTGSNFTVNRYNDAGAFQARSMVINRATGAVAFEYSGSFGGALSVAAALTVGGPTTLSGAFTAVNVIINGPASAERSMFWQTNGSTRWYTGVTGVGEPGSNAGSDWFLAACNDSGAYLGSGIRITRSNLYSYFYAPMTVTTPAGGVGNVQLYPGVSTNSGYIQFNAADSSQAGFIGWALASSKTIYLQAANGYKYQFAGAMAQGPDGTNLGYARKLPRFYTVPSWIEYLSCDTIQVAQAGCNVFFAVTVATQPTLFQGFHCKLANMSGAAMQIAQDTGANLYWVDPSGTLRTGTRNFAGGGFAEVLLVDNASWLLSGSGIS